MFYNATCVKFSRWNCTCTGCASYFILDKALLLFIKLYINLDYISFLPKISMYSHLRHPLKKPSYSFCLNV